MKQNFRFRTPDDTGHNDGWFIQAKNITQAKALMQAKYPDVMKSLKDISVSVRVKQSTGTGKTVDSLEYQVMWQDEEADRVIEEALKHPAGRRALFDVFRSEKNRNHKR